jgi:uncharacterized membrane protein
MPPPELLLAYGQVASELPVRMMVMAEKAQQQEHEREMAELAAAREDMQKNWAVVRWGQFFGFLIGVSALTAGVLSLKIAPNAAGAVMGTILGSGGVATLIWAFRYDRKHSQSVESDSDPTPVNVPRDPVPPTPPSKVQNKRRKKRKR